MLGKIYYLIISKIFHPAVSNAEMKIHHSGNNTHVRYSNDDSVVPLCFLMRKQRKT
jgi:hypothetical protein